MKKEKQFFILLLLFLFSKNLFCQNYSINGIQLCDTVYEFLSNFELPLFKQDIVVSPPNNFPYNIIINFNEQEKNDANNLIICVKMENVLDNKNVIFDLISDLRYRNFNSTVLFIYSRGISFPRRLSISGTQSFIESLDNSKKHTAFILNLESNKNTIQSGSMGENSPSYLVNGAFDAFLKENLYSDLPIYFLSQISKSGFSSNQVFSDFALRKIPTISLEFNKNSISSDKTYRVISNFFDSYTNSKDLDEDYHFMLFRAGNKKIYFSEYTIIKIWIFVIIFSLIFIFILGFANSNLKNSAWSDIKNNWYTIPVVYCLCVFCFFISKLIFTSFTQNGQTATTAFGLPLLQIIISSVFVQTFFILEVTLHKNKYTERSVDFLIVLTTFFNQFIFCLIDISLFPLFMALCVFSVLSLFLKRNWFHILLFIIMLASYLPYIFQLYNSTQSASLVRHFIYQKSNTFVFPLIILPIYMMWFRILTAIRKKFFQTKVFIIINISSFTFIMLFGLLLNNLIFFDSSINSPKIIVTEIEDTNHKVINTDYIDIKNFDDTLRTINIIFLEPSCYANVSVNSKNSKPILYSGQDFFEYENMASFSIPPFPPNELSFTYAVGDNDSTIQIETIVKTDKENEFILYKTNIQTGE